jgi:hypothetical protein
MKRACLMLAAVLPVLAACEPVRDSKCDVVVRIPTALTDIPEGRVREVPLRCGGEILFPGDGRIARLETDNKSIASVRESLYSKSRGEDSERHTTWYLLAHKPGKCILKVHETDQTVTSFEVTVVAQH